MCNVYCSFCCALESNFLLSERVRDVTGILYLSNGAVSLRDMKVMDLYRGHIFTSNPVPGNHLHQSQHRLPRT